MLLKGLIKVKYLFDSSLITYAKLTADEDREWEYKIQEQQDATNIEIQRINAIKEIGVAFGNNQPQTVTYNNIY